MKTLSHIYLTYLIPLATCLFTIAILASFVSLGAQRRTKRENCMLGHADRAYGKEACAYENPSKQYITTPIKVVIVLVVVPRRPLSIIPAGAGTKLRCFWGLALELGTNFGIPTTQAILDLILVEIRSLCDHIQLTWTNRPAIKQSNGLQ